MINQVTHNVDFVLKVLYGSAPIRAVKLDDFFSTMYNFLSEQKNIPLNSFKSLYYQLIAEDGLYDFEAYSNFIFESYPLLSDLLGSYFESRFFNLRPNFNYFSFTSAPSDSFMTEETVFGLYLTNALFCMKKNIRLFPVYSSNNANQSSTDALSKLKSFET